MEDLSLSEYLNSQLDRLCRIVGIDPKSASLLLADLLGPAGSRPLSLPPAWSSGIADDHTPVEFSVAFNHNERPSVRILGESIDTAPSAATNLVAARKFVETQAARFGLSMSRFDRVRDLFAADEPFGGFGLWHSLVFQRGRQPEFKIYLNPELKGVERAPSLVAEALERLGLSGSYRVALENGVRPGELGRADRLTFFAIDLHDAPHARVKLYLSHHDAHARDVVRAASAIDGIDAGEFGEFCMAAGGETGIFAGRPLVSSYTFLGEMDRPAGYSVYVPIRSYVNDDEEARDRVAALLDRYGFDSAELDRIIAALVTRPLHEGVGLIAHVSLRLGLPRPGVTVYLSAEAYQISPPRPRRRPTAMVHAQPPAGRCAA